MKVLHRRDWLCLFALVLGTRAWADEFAIDKVSGQLSEGFYYVNVDASIELAPTVREAVVSGVPLDFAFDFALCIPRKLLWDDCFLKLRRTYRLARHALAESFVVTDLVSERANSQSSLDEALDALGKLREVSIATEVALPSDRTAYGSLRARLDIEALPAPLRPIAYVSPSWHLKSERHEWKLMP